jgi:hypothetical protein
MARVFLSLCLVLTLPIASWSAPPRVASKVDLDNIPGYTKKIIQGFSVLIQDEVFANDEDPRWKRKPTDVLEHELRTIAQVLPERSLKVLRRLLVWVEWDDKLDPDAGKAVAKYYGVFNRRGLWKLAQHKNPLKANNIEIISMRSLTAEHQPHVKLDRCVLLHEMVHAVHFQLFGAQNMKIRAAYNQAIDRHLYDQAKDVLGRTIRPYARASEAEYFAELSCAYLNKLHYYPFDRDGLREHDPIGYSVMVQAWGPPRFLEAAIKSDAEKVASSRLLRARGLRDAGKMDEARTALMELIDTYPKTRAAGEAKEILEKLKSEVSTSKSKASAP